MKNLLILFVTVLFISAGCGQKTEYKIPTAETLNKGNTSETAFVTKKLSKSINNCKPGDSGCSYIRLTYSEATSGNGKDKINLLIKNMMMNTYKLPDKNITDPQIMMDSYIKDCEAFKKQNPKNTKDWMLDFNARVYTETGKLYCLIFENVSYLGDAKLSIITAYKNVYKETGDTVSLRTLLGEGYEDRLNDAVEKKFREMRKLSPGDDLQEKGGLFQKHLNFTNNFAVTKDKGMDFYYNAGEIINASWGPILIKLSPDEVRGLIYGDSPIW